MSNDSMISIADFNAALCDLLETGRFLRIGRKKYINECGTSGWMVGSRD